MTRRLEFYFDFPSPYSNLANTQLPALAQKTGAEIVYRPFRLQELMRAVGNRPTTMECQNKSKYARMDIGRWAMRYKVRVQPNPNMGSLNFPQFTRGAFVAEDEGRVADYVNAIFRAVWIEPVNLSDRSAFLELLNQNGFDGKRFLEKTDRADYVKKLDEQTAAAAERGVFGAPTFFVGNDMFFGNDRLDFVTYALQSA